VANQDGQTDAQGTPVGLFGAYSTDGGPTGPRNPWPRAPAASPPPRTETRWLPVSPGMSLATCSWLIVAGTRGS
jgi:hypothetical protein